MTSINQVDQYDTDDGFEDAFQRWMGKENLDQPYVKEWFDADGMHDILMARSKYNVSPVKRTLFCGMCTGSPTGWTTF